MLTDEQNRTLTQIGPGTPMGDLLRRYWQPIAAETQLKDAAVLPVRLLGEDLVLFKDGRGAYGLLERACAHRLTDLAYGIVEDMGLRCPLHGWLYDRDGSCLEMPLEREPFIGEVRLTSYPVQAQAGLIWAYLGADSPPLVPAWEPFTWDDGLVQIVFSVLDCNWLQCQESAMDPFGVEWLQRDVGAGHSGSRARESYTITHAEIDYGFMSRVSTAGADETGAWTSSQTCLWPNGIFSGDERSCRFEWRVPMEDERTLNVAWFIDRVAPSSHLPDGERVVHWYSRLREDDSVATSPYLTTHVLNRKFKLWLTQKKTIDRTKEHLVDSDRGVVLLRDKYFGQMQTIADGGQPKGLVRDAGRNRAIPLPFSGTPADVDPGSVRPTEFPYLAGQPDDVAAKYEQVLATWRPS